MKTPEKWRAFWGDKKSPLWPDKPDFYRVYAKELKVLFGDKSPTRVLEIGCGNGVMFELLGFDRVQYKGVDFSPHLLAAFRSKHPNVELVCREGSTYADRENQYDLIVSSAVIQYFDMAMLDSHFACARSMMHKDSLFVAAAVPRRLHRFSYTSGRLAGGARPSILQLTRSTIARALFQDPMGYWYEPREIAALADRHGLSFEFYGSMVQLFRFHAVMRLK